MVTDLTHEQAATIGRLAAQRGITPAELLIETATWLVEDDAEEDRLIEARIASADRGEFLTAEEMESRFQQMLKPR